MDIILKAKHWQIFLLLIVPMIVVEFIAEPIYKVLIFVFWTLLFFGWLLLVHQNLTECLPKRVILSSSLFIINIFVLTIALCGVNLFMEPGEVLILEGVWALIGCYCIFAFVQVFYSTAKRLVSVEQGRESSMGECMGETLLLMFFPLGIWFIQPRIKAAFAKNQ